MQKVLFFLAKFGAAGSIALFLVTRFFPYTALFNALDVWPRFENPTAAQTEFWQVIQYLLPPWNGGLNENFFSREDILHLHDVRVIYVILFGLLITCIAGLIYRNRKGGVNMMSAKVPRKAWVGIVAIAAMILATWQTSFVIFHEILFPQNTFWLLDPATSNLIKYFPNGAFQLLFISWLLTAIAVNVGFSQLQRRLAHFVKASTAGATKVDA